MSSGLLFSPPLETTSKDDLDSVGFLQEEAGGRIATLPSLSGGTTPGKGGKSLR
jgi:hypothetical protein